MASLWEIQIKDQLGKLELQYNLKEIMTMQQEINQIQILPITFQHILTLETLPLFHKDPFDRLLISQSITENIPVISKDHYYQLLIVKKYLDNNINLMINILDCINLCRS